MDSNFWYRGTKAVDFRSIPGIAGVSAGPLRFWKGRTAIRVSWRGRSAPVRIAGDTVHAALVEGEGMEMRIAAATYRLAAGATLQASV
jgi:hypothetical protein